MHLLEWSSLLKKSEKINSGKEWIGIKRIPLKIIYLFIYLSIYLFIYLSISLFNLFKIE